MGPGLFAYSGGPRGSCSTRPAPSCSTTGHALAPGLQAQARGGRIPALLSADGKTYTFTIRKGLHFSPPSNEP